MSSDKEEGTTLKKAQTWSMDLVVGTVIFLFLLATFYTLIIVEDEEQVVEQDAETVISQLDKQNPDSSSDVERVFDGTQLDEVSLNDLYNTSYSELKEDMGIRSDFCIVVTIDTPDGGEALLEFGESNAKYGVGTGEDVYIDNETTILCGN